MTKITQSGAAARLTKLTADIETDLAQSLEEMSAEEFSTFLEEEWNDATHEEQERLLWIAQKMQRKTLTLVEEARKEAFEAANQGRRLVAGTDEAIHKVHTEPFYTLHLAGQELLVAVAIDAPREVVLVGRRTPEWTHLVIGQKRYRLKATSNPNVCRCKGLSRAALEDALSADPKLEISVL